LPQKSASEAGTNEIQVTGSMMRAPSATSGQLADRAYAAPRDRLAGDRAYAAFLDRLQSAIRSNDREAAIGLVAFPLRVNFAAGSKVYRDSRSVRADYDRIFTPKVRSAILAQRFDQLFARDQGAMIGNGELWFDHVCTDGRCSPPGPVRIRAINP
jgi:hypothetical protein